MLRSFTHASDFLHATRAYLEQHEAVNGLMLGLAIRLVAEPLAYGSPPYFAAVSDEQGLLLAALMTPPHNVILASDRAPAPEALALVAHDLAEGRWPVAGTVGPVALTDAFVQVWAPFTGARPQRMMSQRLYELRQVNHPRYSPGRLRVAAAAETSLVEAWLDAFQREAAPGGPRSPAASVRQRVADGHIFFWDDHGPVSMALKTRPTPHGICVGGVYTPPALRQRGYATSCVAALSQQLLESGFAYCTLFTDLANPTSNDIYQQIGYRPLCDFQEIKFTLQARDEDPQMSQR